MGHGRAGAARFTGTRAIASPRFVGTVGRGGVLGRTWLRGHDPEPLRELDTGQDETTQLVTRSTYRHLVSRGLAPDEAATLTAFMCGIPIAEVHWSLRQVNELLFLRALVQAGRFGSSDGGRARPH